MDFTSQPGWLHGRRPIAALDNDTDQEDSSAWSVCAREKGVHLPCWSSPWRHLIFAAASAQIQFWRCLGFLPAMADRRSAAPAGAIIWSVGDQVGGNVHVYLYYYSCLYVYMCIHTITLAQMCICVLCVFILLLLPAKADQWNAALAGAVFWGVGGQVGWKERTCTYSVCVCMCVCVLCVCVCVCARVSLACTGWSKSEA